MRRPELFLLAALAACGPETVVREFARPTEARTDELRPDSPNTTEPLPNYAPGDTVERFAVPDASVVVHYTRAGTNRVPLADADDSGVPDFVERVGAIYRDVRVQYHGPWGFAAPPDDGSIADDNGGDAKFDVYLVDFALRADGAFRRECFGSDPVHCTGYMVQENDFSGYGYPTIDDGNVTVSSHEYFHGVQAGYSALQGVNVTEGTAVWATERYAPALRDLEGFAGAYLNAPDRSLDQEPSTAVDSYSYGTGLFFECLTTLRGSNAVRDLWQRIDGGSSWLQTLERNLGEDGGTSLQTVLERCAEYNLFTGSRARGGYGHARSNQLPASTALADNAAPYTLARARMFRASSRYYRVSALPADAVAWWKAAFDAPAGGSATVRVRLAADVSGTPSFITVPEDTPVAIGGAGAAFVLVSNVSTTGSSVPVGLCVGSPAFVESCRSSPDAGFDAGVEDGGFDAGTPDAGNMMPEPPTGCGCTAGASPLGLLALALLRRTRRR